MTGPIIDKAARVIATVFYEATDSPEGVAQALYDAGLLAPPERTQPGRVEIATVEELHALPVGVVLYRDGSVARRADRDIYDGLDWLIAGSDEYRTPDEMDWILPATVIYHPDQDLTLRGAQPTVADLREQIACEIESKYLGDSSFLRYDGTETHWAKEAHAYNEGLEHAATIARGIEGER